MAGLVPQRPQALDTGHFVAGRTVILRELRLDKRDRIELVRDDEVRRLVKSRDTLRPFRLPKLTFPSVRTSLIAASTTSPTSSLTESRCEANGRPRNRS